MYLQTEETRKLAIDRCLILLSRSEDKLKKLSIGTVVSILILFASMLFFPFLTYFVFLASMFFIVFTSAQFLNVKTQRKQLEQLQDKFKYLDTRR